MKYKCLIIDDEPLARELVAAHLSHFNNFELVASCENALAAFEILEHKPIDLIFLDIEMPVLKGNEFLKKLTKPPKVVFTTAYRDYAIESYELNVVDYLLKPITFDRFFKCIDKFISHDRSGPASFVEHPSEFIFISSGTKNIKLHFREVLYVESFKDYIKIHLSNGTFHHIKFNISAFHKLLNACFLRIHRSFIINTDKVSGFTKNEVFINDLEIPLGDTYRDNWLGYLKTLPETPANH